MRMTYRELQIRTRGTWYGTPPSGVSGLSTDTRTLKKGEAFLALRGPIFDGHRFAGEAVKRGASAVIGEAGGLWHSMPCPRLEVNNTLDALGDIAGAWRQQLSATVVAITGSYGKTTVRSMLEHGLRRLGLNVAATNANNNNLIGVPQTILGTGKDADVALVECGISEMGAMQRLARIVQPDIALITGLAPTHAEGLGDVHGVAHEKGLLLQYLTEDGCAVLGAGVSAMMRDRLSSGMACIDVDEAADASVVHGRIQEGRCLLRCGDETATVELAIPACHWAADMALTATVIRHLTNRKTGEIADALAGWQAVSGRMQPLPGIHASIIIHDAYNANPVSVTAALDTVRQMPGRHFAVLGDMAELGMASRSLHAALDISGMDGLVLVGGQMEVLAGGCSAAEWVPDVDAAIRTVKTLNLHAGDVVLVKGSRCMGLEKVVGVLTHHGAEAPMDGEKREERKREEKADAV